MESREEIPEEYACYVTNIALSCKRDEIMNKFKKAGEIHSIYLRKRNNIFCGVAFIYYTCERDANKAIKWFNNNMMRGKRIIVRHYHREKQPSQPVKQKTYKSRVEKQETEDETTTDSDQTESESDSDEKQSPDSPVPFPPSPSPPPKKSPPLQPSRESERSRERSVDYGEEERPYRDSERSPKPVSVPLSSNSNESQLIPYDEYRKLELKYLEQQVVIKQLELQIQLLNAKMSIDRQPPPSYGPISSISSPPQRFNMDIGMRYDNMMPQSSSRGLMKFEDDDD